MRCGASWPSGSSGASSRCAADGEAAVHAEADVLDPRPLVLGRGESKLTCYRLAYAAAGWFDLRLKAETKRSRRIGAAAVGKSVNSVPRRANQPACLLDDL